MILLLLVFLLPALPSAVRHSSDDDEHVTPTRDVSIADVAAGAAKAVPVPGQSYDPSVASGANGTIVPGSGAREETLGTPLGDGLNSSGIAKRKQNASSIRTGPHHPHHFWLYQLSVALIVLLLPFSVYGIVQFYQNCIAPKAPSAAEIAERASRRLSVSTPPRRDSLISFSRTYSVHSLAEHAGDDNSEDALNDARKMEDATAISRACSRLGAILTTTSMAYAVVLLVAVNSDIIVKHPLIAAFQAMISAIAGNVGLQSATVTVRALSHNFIDASDYWAGVAPEAAAGCFTAVIMSFVLFCMGFATHRAWCDGTLNFQSDVEASPGDGVSSMRVSITFGIVVAIGQGVTCITASIFGSWAPLFLKRATGTDPASWVGPLETAFQDIVGNFVVLKIAQAMLSDMPTC